MPSTWHDTARILFERTPELAVEILRDLMGVEVPPGLPLQIGPVPKTVKAKEMAADPAMAVLSVAYHGDDPAVAEAFVAGITSPEVQNGEAYYEYGYIMSTTDVRRPGGIRDNLRTAHQPVPPKEACR
jgi:hypothetical protein